jgi:hypothetical protein
MACSHVCLSVRPARGRRADSSSALLLVLSLRSGMRGTGALILRSREMSRADALIYADALIDLARAMSHTVWLDDRAALWPLSDHHGLSLTIAANSASRGLSTSA